MKKVKLSDVRGPDFQPAPRQVKPDQPSQPPVKPPTAERLRDEAAGKIATGVVTAAAISAFLVANSIFYGLAGSYWGAAVTLFVAICMGVSAIVSMRLRSVTAGIFGLSVFGIFALLGIYGNWIALQEGYYKESSLVLGIAMRGIALALLLRGVEGLMAIRRLDKKTDNEENLASAGGPQIAKSVESPDAVKATVED